MNRFFIIFLLLTLVTACKSHHRVNITEKAYLTNYKNVVLTEIRLPEGLENKALAKEQIKKKVTEVFASRGVNVLDESVYLEEYQKQEQLAGGVYHPITGKRDQRKAQSIEDETLRQLKATQGINSALFYDVRVKAATIDNYRAEWDGASEKYELNNNDFVNFLSAIVVDTSGKIAALSLTVFLQDMENKELYYGAGGIELLMKLDDNDKFVPVPDEQILDEEPKLDFAVNEAFRKLFPKKRVNTNASP